MNHYSKYLRAECHRLDCPNAGFSAQLMIPSAPNSAEPLEHLSIGGNIA
jgi:hypothetical protein